jgi:Tfp pilus assembly protein PilF
LSQGKLKEAIFHYSKAIEFKPDYVQVYNKIGSILLKQGKFRKASVFFSKALQIDPGFSEARDNLDIVRKRMSK